MVRFVSTRIDQLRAISDPLQRAKEAALYADQHTAAAAEGNAVRDEAIVDDLIPTYGVTETARLMGLSVARVKQIRKG
jgi:hypothetical protein